MQEDEVADIDWQKLSLERSFKPMQADVDDYLTLAEEKNDISHFAKAKTFRKTVRERSRPGNLKTGVRVKESEMTECTSCSVSYFIGLLD